MLHYRQNSAAERHHLSMAAGVIAGGGVVLHATEGVWGLACDPLNAKAVARVLSLKQRSVEQGLIVIGHDADDFAPELESLDDAAIERIRDSWPGAVSWVVPNRYYPAWITGRYETVAIRVPAHPQARALCALTGPLVSTSANLSGRPAPTTALLARRAMGSGVDYVLPGETLGRRKPSEVRTVSGQALRGG